jgi:hypothetical protein
MDEAQLRVLRKTESDVSEKRRIMSSWINQKLKPNDYTRNTQSALGAGRGRIAGETGEALLRPML